MKEGWIESLEDPAGSTSGLIPLVPAAIDVTYVPISIAAGDFLPPYPYVFMQ
jgi:hypothetical protein